MAEKNIDFKMVQKLKDSGKTWNEVKALVPGFTDTDRKIFYGIVRYAKDFIDDESILKREQNIRVAKKRLGIERSINNEQIRDISLHKTFVDQVIEKIEELPKLNFDKYFFNLEHNEEVEEDAHIFTLSDFHYTGVQDEMESFKKALQHIREVVHEKNLSKIYLVELGDIIEGASLRNSQLMGVKKGMVNQVMEMSELYANFLTEIQKFVDVEFIVVSSSNHTQLRNMGTKQNELIEEDLMRVFIKFISLRLPDLKLTWDREIIKEICGFTMYFAHGHLNGKKDGDMPKVEFSTDKNFDFGFFGHYHHMITKDLVSIKTDDKHYDKRVFYVPAMTDTETDYEKTLRLSSTAGIGYYTFNKKYGNVEAKKLLI